MSIAIKKKREILIAKYMRFFWASHEFKTLLLSSSGFKTLLFTE